jgi:hypothetical protein
MTFLWVCALLLYVVLGAANLYFGDLNQDEGWYLYSARQVHEGSLPYRDFAFTQGPMLPLVYSFAYPLVERWGVAGGRLVSLLLGFAGAMMAASLASRAAPSGRKCVAALLAFILVAGNVYQSYNTTVVKTYSLCALFLVGGLLALSYVRSRAGRLACFAAGLLLAFSAGTRLSAGVALPVAGLYLLFMRRHFGDSRWLSFAVGGAMGLGAIFLPFLKLAPDGFWFGLFEYHSQRSAGGILPALVYKAGFISRFVQAYFLPVCLTAAIALFRWLKPEPAETQPTERFNVLLWVTGLAVTLVHFSAPFPYDDYQVMVYPVFAAALAGSLILNFAFRISDRWMLWLLVSVFVASVASAFSSPVNQSWAISGRDRIWWKVKDETQLQKLRKVSAWISERLGGNDLLLTQDTYLAVEAGCRVPKGMEMGSFSYFPGMCRARAEQLRVLNRELLLELLEHTEAPVAAFSGYGLAIRSPQISEISESERQPLWDEIEKRYEEIYEVPDFGQAFTTLRIFKLK